ncbi:hypothetical protein [Actinomadura violacea]|uniref:Uncharacterized protein n=1 Tax=Actinomadura violacea TaxID=2819934 RepID=A0ABS3RZY3_9ACTN|nr:hypothetical protein [Actinomadura violacea]MBO2461575.1 hypothetical protein [Actinomadura violacea]
MDMDIVFSARQQARLAEARKRGGTTTLRRTFRSTIGAHRLWRRIAMDATRLGLAVDYQHDGGWFTRTHQVVVRGPAVKVAAYDIVVEEFLALCPGRS